MKHIIRVGMFLTFTHAAFAQTDLTPPALVCVPILTVDAGAICSATVFDNDLIDFGTDFENFSVKFGIRKSCAGIGFPQNQHSINYSSADLGDNFVELWAMDSVGNVNVCQTRVEITVNNGGCEFGGITNIYLESPLDSGVASVNLMIESGNCLGDSSLYEYTSGPLNEPDGSPSAGVGQLNLREGYGIRITPSKNINPLNGVTTNDLLLIQKHILGFEPLDSPYKLIAADANFDGKITTFDIVLLRKLMVGIIDKLPNDRSWRFVPKNFVFPDPQNPTAYPFPEVINIPKTAHGPIHALYFTAIKLGDVNFSADPNN